MKDYNDEKVLEKALIVASFDKKKTDDYIADYLTELNELALACNLEPQGIIIQRRDKIEVTTFIGSGKVKEVESYVRDHDIDIVVFNEELSGVQIRNLENALDVKVIDRTMLILDIFARRAKSSIARMQVELAQQKYRLPRLIGLNDNLSKTGSGIGARGPGEQKLELDRRKINDRIADLTKRLREAEAKAEVTKKSRQKSAIKTCALVGYTNAGKSTILNLFVDKYGSKDEDAKVFAKDMLFATLDTYSRRLNLDNKCFIMSDTVGFVSDLPHGLVNAFSSTLSEVKDADFVLNIIDYSDKNHLMHREVTLDTLKMLDVDLDKVITVYNKIDAVDGDLESDDKIYVSALTEQGIDKLSDIIITRLFGSLKTVTFLFPYDKQKFYDGLMNKAEVLDIQYVEEGSLVTAVVTSEIYEEFKEFEV